ncbi:MAG: MerR family transcriptional regulator, partial [Vicinamibacteria bacterium]
MVKKIPNKLFFKIGEVCELTETQPYVLRYWESEFPALAPAKNNSGQRIYRR